MALLFNQGDTVSRSYSYAKPSPTHISQPEETGDKTANLANLVLGKVPRAADGTLVTFNGLTCEYVPITSMSDTFSLTFEKTGSTKKFYVYFYSGDTLLNTKDLNYGTTITTYGVSNTVDRMRIRIDYGEYTVSDVMLVKGSTPAASYEPYGYAIPISCAGQTVPVYLGQVSTVRKVRKRIFDGTENWSTDGNTGTCYRYRLTLDDGGLANAQCVCSHFPYRLSYTGDYEHCYIGTVFYIFSEISTKADFMSWIAEQYAAGTPVTVWYVLATPQTAIVNEPLCKIGDYADELSSTDAAVTIPTAKGANTLTIGTTLQPSEVSITGKIKSS